MQDLGVILVQGNGRLRLADLLAQPLDHRALLLNYFVRLVKGFEHLSFRNLGRARLDHQDGLGRSGDDQLESGSGYLGMSRVDDELTLLGHGNADATDRPGPRNVGDRQGSRRAENGVDVGQVIHVRRQRHRDDLSLVAHVLVEQRAKRSVDQARGQDRLLAGTPAALDESAGDLAHGVLPLLVVTGEREKIQAGLGVHPHGGRTEDDRVTGAHGNRAVRLLGEPTGFDGDDLAVRQGHLLCVHRHVLFFSSS